MLYAVRILLSIRVTMTFKRITVAVFIFYHILAAIKDNGETLEIFWMAGQSFNQQWDCSIFRTCRSLRKLCVQLYMSPKVNLGSIPPTVTKLNMSGCLKRVSLHKSDAFLTKYRSSGKSARALSKTHSTHYRRKCSNL